MSMESNDREKGIVWKKACNHLNIIDIPRRAKYPSHVSTKIDVSSLLVILEYTNDTVTNLLDEWDTSNYVMLCCDARMWGEI